MATTLLQGVNRVLRRVGEISSVSPDLTSLTDSARQIQIDRTVALWQEAIELVQSFADLPQDVGSGTITLVTSTREYSAASDYQGFVGEYMVCSSPAYTIPEYPGGYTAMFEDQPDPSLFSGQPGYWVYNPVTSKFRMDRAPTSSENGQVLTYLYDKALSLSAAADVIPLPDQAANMLSMTVAEIYRLDMKGRMNGSVWKVGLANCIRIAGLKAKSNAYA